MTELRKRPHIACCYVDNERRRHAVLLRSILLRESGGEAFATVQTMGGPQAGAVAEVLKLALERSDADISISERTLPEIEAEPFVEDANLFYSAAPGMSLMLYAPEGRPGENPADTANRTWTDLWRNPWGGASSSAQSGRFRERSLHDVLAQRFAPDRQRTQTTHRTEIWVRRDWLIRDLAGPRAFEPDEPAPRSRPTAAEERQQALASEVAYLLRQT